MRPGITGLVQATVRNSESWDDRIKIDNKYIEEFNVLLDFKILIMTFFRVLKSEDIYAPKVTEKDSMSKK
jgi:lipopolysaccharide/colanic/teichoic acid biosynthesis glycosyltransferase